jgi:hypothetical protein
MLSYVCQMLMLYWVGAWMHAFPWGDLEGSTTNGVASLWSLEVVFLGLQQSTYAIVAFTVGALAIGPLVANGLPTRQRIPTVPDEQLPRLYILYGIGSYMIMAPTLGKVHGFNAIGAVGAQLVVVGCCLNCWRAWWKGGTAKLLLAVIPSLIIPCVTVVLQGFLGFGVMAVLTILVFCGQFFRPRWLLVLCFAVSIYLGLSVYITYMKGRNELRVTVWGGQTMSERFAKFVEVAGNFEFFNPWDDEHLVIVDNRLNQNGLVGTAVLYLENTDDYARGDTLREALLGMIPRLVWRDKPIEAGSGDLASRFTGLEFAEGTSVGVGPVMELYGNFGTPAVVIGFLILGALLSLADSSAGAALIAGNWQEFGAWCLVGISMLNVSGSFVETSMGAAASVVLAVAVNKLLRVYGRGPRPVDGGDAMVPAEA